MAIKVEYLGIRTQQTTLLTSGMTAATWQATHTYALNALVKPVTANGHYYRCATAGQSAATAPTWPVTFQGTVTDGAATWREEEPVNILDYDPVGFSYPCIIVGEIIATEGQIASGNVMSCELTTPLRIIAYQGGTIPKTWTNMRKQAYDVLMQTQAIIRAYPDLSNYAKVVAATTSEATPVETENVFYEIQVQWKARVIPK